jgi:beta-xylosidase
MLREGDKVMKHITAPIFFPAVILLVSILACGFPAAAPATPTHQPLPPTPVLPSQEPSPTETPSSLGFLDGFDDPVLGEGWAWLREDTGAWSLTERPGWLQLNTGNFFLLGAGGDAPILLRNAIQGDFELRARLDFAPSQNFQFAGIVIYQDDDNFVALGRAYCAPVPPCGGDGIYLDNDERFMAGDTSAVFAGGAPVGLIHLRLVWQGQTYSGYWSTDGQAWIAVGTTEAAFNPQRVGIFAANSGSGTPSAPAWFDEFEVIGP